VGKVKDLDELLERYIGASVRLTHDGCIHPEEAERLDRVLAPYGLRVRRDHDLRLDSMIRLEVM
jgi:hypothetical protein